jgi:hypothetical protein
MPGALFFSAAHIAPNANGWASTASASSAAQQASSAQRDISGAKVSFVIRRYRSRLSLDSIHARPASDSTTCLKLPPIGRNPRPRDPTSSA